MAPQLKEQMESRGLEVVAISDMKVLVKYAKKSQDEHKRLIRESKRGDQDTGVLERFLNRRLGGRQPPKEQPSVRILVSPRKANRKTNGTFSTQQTPDPDRIVVSPTKNSRRGSIGSSTSPHKFHSKVYTSHARMMRTKKQLNAVSAASDEKGEILKKTKQEYDSANMEIGILKRENMQLTGSIGTLETSYTAMEEEVTSLRGVLEVSEAENQKLDLQAILEVRNYERYMDAEGTLEQHCGLDDGVTGALSPPTSCDIAQRRGKGGAPSMEFSLLALRLLIARVPPSQMNSVISAVLKSQNFILKSTLPNPDWYRRVRRALHPFNLIMNAVVLGVAEKGGIGMNIDGKGIAGYEQLGFTFTVQLPDGSIARFAGGCQTVVDSSALGGAETVARRFQRMQELRIKVRLLMEKNGLDKDDPLSYWKCPFAHLGVPRVTLLSDVCAIGSDSCNTMVSQCNKIDDKINEQLREFASPIEEQDLGNDLILVPLPLGEIGVEEPMEIPLERVLEDPPDASVPVNSESTDDANNQPETTGADDSGARSKCPRVGCVEHYLNNGIDKGMAALIALHLKLMEEANGSPLTPQQRATANPLLLLRQVHTLLEMRAKYHLNIFNKELKPWLLENHEDEAWLFYPRGVGSRFWVIVLAVFAFLHNLMRLILFLAHRRKRGHQNKLENNVWNGAVNGGVVNTMQSMALICDQVVHPSLTALPGQQVGPGDMGTFMGRLEGVLLQPRAVLNADGVLESLNPEMSLAAAERRNRKYSNIGSLGKRNGSKSSIDMKMLTMFANEEMRDRALKLITAFCDAMVEDLQVKAEIYLTSQDGVWRTGQKIPDMVLLLGHVNTGAERLLSSVTYNHDGLLSASIEAVSGLSANQLNRTLEQTTPLTPKKTTQTAKEMEENFAIGLGEKLNEQFLLICVEVATSEIDEERKITQDSEKSQEERAKQKTDEEIELSARRTLKQAHNEAIALARIKDGALIESRDDLETAFDACCAANPDKSPSVVTHALCHDQIVLYALGLRYEDAISAKFTKQKKKLDLRDLVRRLQRQGFADKFERRTSAESEEEEEVFLPGPQSEIALSLEKVKRDEYEVRVKAAAGKAESAIETEKMTRAEKEMRLYMKDVEKLDKETAKEKRRVERALARTKREKASEKKKAEREHKKKTDPKQKKKGVESSKRKKKHPAKVGTI